MSETATEENYTHVVFYYDGKGKMTVNKHTYLHVYPNEKDKADSWEYLIKEAE